MYLCKAEVWGGTAGGRQAALSLVDKDVRSCNMNKLTLNTNIQHVTQDVYGCVVQV